MKALLPVLIRGAAGVSLGFGVAVAVAGWSRKDITPSHGFHSSGGTEAGMASPASAIPLRTLPPSGIFQNLNTREKLDCLLAMRRFSLAELQAALRDGLTRPEPERTELLRPLLAQWAETAPAAACVWILDHPELDPETSRKCMDDSVRVWAVRDGHALAHWVNDLSRKNTSQLAKEFNAAAMNALEMHDPFEHALMAEMECNRTWTWTGSDFARSLRTPEAIKAMAARLPGHVAYIDDIRELKRQLAGGYGNRNASQKNLINQLFQNTAVAWHRISPEECAAWLDTFPENARLVARHEIEKAERSSLPAAPSAQPSDE